MKNKLFTVLSALACASLAIALAPATPTALAGNGGHHGHHYDDPEAQQWYEFAHDKGIEINHILQNYSASIERKTYYATRHISSLCEHCDEICRGGGPCCDDNRGENRRLQKRKKIARKAKLKIGKCVWEAQMNLEDCYADARQQLEDAGYDYFLPYIYNPYRNTQRHLVKYQRKAQHHLQCAVYCQIDSTGGGGGH